MDAVLEVLSKQPADRSHEDIGKLTPSHAHTPLDVDRASHITDNGALNVLGSVI